MALAAQALEAKKAWKPLEQGGALEQVAARIERVMGLTIRVQPPPQAVGCDEKLERDDKNVNNIYRSFFFLFVRRKGRGL